ncbi:Lon protease family protein [Spirochaeta africana]|uniref:endopeptidase La n=1 Tax=Spirochaeta africana (strain ATCC 700263 / DSM 8902 / Z-7692) TaxID=889378 RepID=H9UFP3_SPIAZ|nr:ATP-binding protein [Spirochaeta africana]AFG36336.1 putative ATP-dependent protease [Spirochaeta africana DSM 8902]
MAQQPRNKDLYTQDASGPDRYLIPPERVHFSISPDYVEGIRATTDEFHIIGQPRALRAIEMAIAIDAKGYNVFATGLPGTGKRTAITKILKSHTPNTERVLDLAYAARFDNDEAPRLLRFTKGEAKTFQRRLKEVLQRLRSRSQELFKKKPFRDQRDSIIISTEGKDSELLKSFETRLEEHGFQLVRLMDQDESMPDIFPVIDGEVIDFDELQNRVKAGSIAKQDFQQMREQYFRFTDEMNQLFQAIHDNRISMEEDIDTLRRTVLQPLIAAEFERLSADYQDEPIQAHIEAMKTDLQTTLSQPEDEENTAERFFARYSINIVVDHSETEGAPVVFETNPDSAKLFGVLESQQESAEPKPMHQLLRAGSLLQASGGFLILRAEDVLHQEDVWNGLKRALEDSVTEIRNHPGPYGLPGPALKPDPIPIHLKVIMMGTDGLYELLYNIDEDFQKLFKVPAEFDSVMPRNDQAIREYIAFSRMICSEEKLFPTSPDGMAAVIEYGVRLAEHRNHISTQFSLIADLLREANYWAGQMSCERITAEVIHRAFNERRFFANLPEEKIDEQIQSGELLIDLQGSAVGRINGLAILDRGYYAFGRPMLITARVAPGSEGIINIERESGLSGEIHDKGIYIIEGYLQTKYAKDFPQNIRASIAFEQSYSEVDGDSASSTEIYVLLSAISGVPLRQDIAVSGSVNQTGEIQPVGGISEKVEGFFHICRKLGLTGKQGVVIPKRNLDMLILSREVQEAVQNGFFHIYAIDTIDQGLEILTGMEAGVPNRKGYYPPETLNGKIERRLREMALLVKEFGGS